MLEKDSYCYKCRFYTREIGLCTCPEDILGLECPYMDFMVESPDPSGDI